MISIFHLSDFHLNEGNLRDWNTYIKDCLIEMINEKIATGNECFVVCSGDLIDKGGKGYKSTLEAFKEFRTSVIDPILEATKLPIERFIITPGNHDVDRAMDKDFMDTGLKVKFSNDGVKYLNEFTNKLIINGKTEGMKRMDAFHTFAKEIYRDSPDVDVTYLGMSFVFKTRVLSIGFACLNSSWTCYDDGDFDKGVYVGEPQYNRCREKLKSCNVRIAMMHHPLDWLKLEKDFISKWIYNDYDMFLCGHIHENQTTLASSAFGGSLFINVAPCFTNEIRENSNSFANGITLIDYEPSTKQGTAYYYKYLLVQRKYVLNVDYAQEGKYTFAIYNKLSDDEESIIKHSSDYIKEIHYKKFDDSLIPQKANVNLPLTEAFVMPTIIKYGDESRQKILLSDIINNKTNVLIFGAYESGKSVLLYRLVTEINENVEQYGKLPVYLDFNDLGNRDIESEIRVFLDLSSKQVKILLQNRSIILLIDNYNPKIDNKYNTNKVYQFLKQNDITCIATYSSNMGETFPQSFYSSNNEISFEYYHLCPFRAENIRDLVTKWMPEKDVFHLDNEISKMVNNFCAYSLPCTAMSVSLYLWSMEKEKSNPINQATLLDIYIEIILEKLSKENVYHNTFDYENRVSLISYIAYTIRCDIEGIRVQNQQEVVDDSYVLSYERYLAIIAEYLQIIAMPEKYDVVMLGENFIETRIFRKEGNNVKFAHSCYYYFFLAKRMIKDKNFREKILEDKNYCKNERTLDYYGGLTRSDEQFLVNVIKRVNEFFNPYQMVYDDIDIDNCFTNIIKKEENFEPVIQGIDDENVMNTKPSIERIQKHKLEVCDAKISRITDDFNQNQEINPESLIVILGRALRNLDSVENVGLKKEAYHLFVKSSLIYAVISKNTLAIYANNHSGELPPFYSFVVNVESFFRNMPFILQYNLNEMMGTSKLETIFYDKTIWDKINKRSDVEKYFSLAMLMDNTGLKYIKDIEEFVDKVRKNCVCDYLFFRFRYMYSYQTVSGSTEERTFRRLLSRLSRCVKSLRGPIDKVVNDKKRIRKLKR